MSCSCTKTVCAAVLVVLGVVLVIVGGISLQVFKLLFDAILTDQLTISEGTIFYDLIWKEVETPTYLDYYFFNVTNAEEFLTQSSSGSIKLQVEEVGPYVYREYLNKDNIIYEEPDLVNFRQKTEIYFWESRSNGSENDLITTANIVAGSLIPILEYHNVNLTFPILKAINKLFEETKSSLLITRSVHDLLFGYQDDIYDKIAGFIKELLPDATIPDNFGLFMNTNKSKGWFNYQVNSGKYNLSSLNMITKFKNESKLDYWKTEQCNMLNGTDGTTTPPYMKQEDYVYFFVDDVCRSLYGVFEKEVEVRGVKGWKVTTPREIFQSPQKNEYNDCFCHHNTSILCHHDGGISLQACQHGAPIAITCPHYLFGEGFYLDMVEGISPPDTEKHVAALVYEPITGTAIKVDKRLQINMLIDNEPRVSMYQPINKTLLFPVLWVNENAEITDEDAEILISLLYDLENIIRILQIVVCIVGGIILLSSVFYLSYKCLKVKEIDDLQMDKVGIKNSSFTSEDQTSSSQKF